MSEIKVNSIKGVGASAAAITVNNTDGTCTANITNNLSNRRLTINGAMQVAQRGQTFNSVTTNTVTIDRFKWEQGGANNVAVFNVTQTSDAAREIGFENSLKAEVATVDASLSSDHYSQFKYLIETNDIIRQSSYGLSTAKKMTLSFYVKCSVTGTFPLALNNGSGSRSNPHIYTINSANTWERKTITFNGDTGGVWQSQTGNAAGFGIRWGLAVGSTYFGTADGAWAADSSYAKSYASYSNSLISTSGATWELTGVQLEVSDHATDFEFRSFGQELALCQRYYYVAIYSGNSGKSFANLSQYSASDSYGHLQFAATMRASPTLEVVTGTNYYGAFGNAGVTYLNTLALTSAHQNGAEVNAASSRGQGNAVWLRTNNANAQIAFSAEL